jgi:hypothetical protein
MCGAGLFIFQSSSGRQWFTKPDERTAGQHSVYSVSKLNTITVDIPSGRRNGNRLIVLMDGSVGWVRTTDLLHQRQALYPG